MRHSVHSIPLNFEYEDAHHPPTIKLKLCLRDTILGIFFRQVSMMYILRNYLNGLPIIPLKLCVLRIYQAHHKSKLPLTKDFLIFTQQGMHKSFSKLIT